MTEILCRWLNDHVKVSPKLSDENFPEQLSSGYLLGEVLNNHGLQEDFPYFSKGKTSEAKLNNFMRLEPTFRLLEIPFNINLARDVMEARAGAAMKLLYQLFIALNRMKRQKLSGQCLEFTHSPGRIKLEKVETSIFQERLKHQTPRQVDLNFEELIDKFKERRYLHEATLMRERKMEAERLRREQRDNCHKALERTREAREKQLMYTKLKPLSPTKMSGNGSGEPAMTTTGKRTGDVRQSRAVGVAEETRASIDSFEARLKSIPVNTVHQSPPHLATAPATTSSNLSGDYICRIKRRAQDSEAGRKERERRRHRVLVQQMNALQEQEEERHKQQLVERLMRQCQQESRIATQLMHIRRQKDTIRNNRIFRLKQFEEQRMKEFQEALNRKEELSKQAEKERLACEAHHLMLYQQHKAKQAEENYHKHYRLAASVMDQILDLSTRIAEYRELTENMVPAKLVHDWKTLLISGQPLYPECEEGEGEGGSSSRLSQSTCTVPPSAVARDTLLDETDFWQYRNVQVDWAVDEGVKVDLPEPHCPILTHTVYSLLDQVDPPQPPPTPPKFPKFILRASLVGKPFSGKTTVLTQLNHQLGIVVLCPTQLVQGAVQQYLGEKSVLEAQLALNTSRDEETPLVSSNNEGDDQIDKAESGGSMNGSINGESTGETPAIEPDNEGSEIDTSEKVEEGEEGEEGDRGSDGGKGNEATREPQTTEEPPPYFSELSVVGALGCRAHLSLCRGEQVQDHITVGIIEETLRGLPEECSWVLDNFPTTLEQAKLLNKSLTGECTAKSRFSRDFVLLPEHQRKSLELQAKAGLDLVIHLTTSSEVVLQRAATHSTDQPRKLDHIQHRLLSFEAGWSRLKRWLHKFRVLTAISTCQDMDFVASAVHERVKDIINKTKQHEAMMKLGITKSMLQLSCGSSSSLPTLKKLEARPLRSPHSNKHPLEKTTRKKRTRRPSSAGAPPPLHAIQQADNMTEVRVSKEIQPGESDWEYCSLPVADEMAECLAGKWGEIERCYVTALKTAFQSLRKEREIICRYFHKRKCEFGEYLKRPDHKQELLSQWQSEFNSLPIHQRREAAMKAELHCKVDDLCDKLWDICDVRKEEWEVERNRIMAEHWLEDHLGLVCNTYICLIQAELVKFQDTVVLLQDYYGSFQGSTPAQLPSPARVPLIELSSTEPQDPPSSSTDLASDPTLLPHTSSTATKKRGSKVLLLPRKPPPVPSSDDKAGGGGKKKEKGSSEEAVPQPSSLEDPTGLELDQQLVVHTYNTALTSIQSMVYPLIQSLDSSIETTTALLQPPRPTTSHQTPGAQAEEKTGGKGGKGGKEKGSPSKKGKQTPAKKGAPDPPPPAETPAPTLSEGEKEKKKQLIKAWREHKTALHNQESSVKQRLMLIKTKAVAVVDYLKSIAAKMNEDMEVWIGQHYRQEVDCVTELAGILCQAVEDEDPLSPELRIPGKTFYIDGSVMLLEEAPPQIPPAPLEAPPPGVFSVTQLHKLRNQFSAIAPEGFMLARTFGNTLHGFTDNTCGEFLLPDSWYGITKETVQHVCDELYGKEADYVDWKHFLVCAAQPWHLPHSYQLLATLERFQESVGKDQQASRQQFMAVQTWMDEEEGREEGERKGGFNRTEKLKQFLYELFSNKDKKVDYTNMLLYMCVDASAEVGLSKALSLVAGTEISLNEHDDLGDIKITLDDFYRVLTHGTYSSDVTSQASISEEMVRDIFDRLSGGQSVSEVALSELLLDPVTVDYLDSLTCYTLPDLQRVLRASSSAATETD